MAASTVSALFKPLEMGSLTLRNRVIMSPLTRSRSTPTNVPNEYNLEHYRQRARGGAGLIISEGTLVTQQGTQWENAPGIWGEEHVVAWKKITDAVHAEGGHIFAQLWHVGRLCHPDAPEQKASGTPVYAPSAVAASGGKFRFLPGSPGYVTPTAIEDPSVLVEAFKKAGINAKEAGFDGVEVHGANGYLVHQFLDTNSNIRTDAWGGSVPNRARFGLEIIKELVGVFGPDRVGVKLSPAAGYNDVGMPLQETVDTYSYFVTEAQKLGLAYACFMRLQQTVDVQARGPSTDHDFVETYKPLMTSTKFFLNGGLTPEDGAALIEAGKIDGAVFGWLWIAHPDLARRIEKGIPLDNQVNFQTLFASGHEGYNDYPAAT